MVPIPTQSPEDQQTETRDRLLRLEVSNHYEREALYREIGNLALQIHTLKQEVQHASVLTPVSVTGWLKLALALLLPLAVLLSTGSPRQAMEAAHMAVGR